MNILILTGRFGMGHYSVAEAIRQEIHEKSPNVQVSVVDLIDYLFPMMKEVVYGGFRFMVSKCSFVYNILNEITAKWSEVPLEKTVVKKLDRLLSEHRADLVIATLPVCAQYLSAYKRMTGKGIPLYTYVTDLTVQDEWICEKTDVYFVGDQGTKKQLMKKGIHSADIIVSGIPVKTCFQSHEPISHTGYSKEVLLMGGGLGLIPSSDRLLEALCAADNLHVVVITGKNEKLHKHLKQKFPMAEVIGYTNQVHQYMKQADLILTKSGGITTFEAIYSETPLYVMKPFLSQEMGNATFIDEKHIGQVAWSKQVDVASDVLSLLGDAREREEMRENMRKIRENLNGISPLGIFNERGEKLCG